MAISRFNTRVCGGDCSSIPRGAKADQFGRLAELVDRAGIGGCLGDRAHQSGNSFPKLLFSAISYAAEVMLVTTGLIKMIGMVSVIEGV